MKFIKRRHEGEYHNTHFIMWQNGIYHFRLFINFFKYQLNYNLIDPKRNILLGTLHIRKVK